YGALRHQELALKEDHVYSTFEVRQGSGSAPESERPGRVSASRQPTLTTWTDPEDGMVYIDVPAYPLPALPIQTPPSPEWTSGSLPISSSPSVVPSPISSPMIPLTVPSPVATPAIAKTEGFLTKLGAQVEIQGGLIRDHAVRLEELSPALFKRSLEYEQERVAVTFGAIWRPVLALEPWAGQTDAKMMLLRVRNHHGGKCVHPGLTNVRRTVADFSHVPPNEYSPSLNDKKQWDIGGKLIQKLRQKGVYEESFSRHAA
ncbi:hypothetical protein Tco_0981886, partial [Tanacetum coccineum]